MVKILENLGSMCSINPVIGVPNFDLCRISILVGGLEHFLFSHILGRIIPIDFNIFQRGSNHQPDFIPTVLVASSFSPFFLFPLAQLGDFLFFSSQLIYVSDYVNIESMRL